MDIVKQFEPHYVEKRIHNDWLQNNCFAAHVDDKGTPYCIVIPPPNVTGALHLGHAINNTLQDIVIRHRRMQGDSVLWLPGMDHAGIATQAVVEKRLLEKEGKTRHDVGRDGLVARIWEWKEQFGGRIIDQLKSMGCSCDWSRTRFTLDDQCARAVRHTFFSMFKDGLIYRGKRLVNWDAHLQTAVSDDEVYHETVNGHLWYYRYPVKGTDETVLIATTRPETMLGDTAVAVHPDDERYAHLIGKLVVLPLTQREIPVIADDILVDPKFGTGCVKVTPAHDPNDYECALRHDLEMINILNPDGTINENGGAFAGMERSAARKAVIAALKEDGVFEKEENYETQIGHSDRSKTPIEPYLSDQWFITMADLAQAAMDVVEEGRIQFHPPRYAKMYHDWLAEKRDWPISRQLWWGHRIPIWYARGCDEKQLENAFADRNDIAWHRDDEYDQWLICAQETDLEPDAIPGITIEQETDVLDTWFSSALWPHSTLGWPEHTPDLEKWYPTNTLITSRDIVTLWVARMVMTGLYNMKNIPFNDVVIHIKVLDGQGQTMSKSKGNGVDPVDIIEQYGADALRFSVAHMATETQDVRMPVLYKCPHCGELTPQTEKNMHDTVLTCSQCKKDMATRWADETEQEKIGLALLTSDKFEIGRNFANKIWNASRFVLMNLDEGIPVVTPDQLAQHVPPNSRTADDEWILAHLDKTIENVTNAINGYHFHDIAVSLYDFIWNQYCDWYVESAKNDLNGDDTERKRSTQIILACVLNTAIRMLHPMMPFITEEIWRLMHEIVSTEMPSLLITAHWPATPPDTIRDSHVELVNQKFDIIKHGRSLRSEFNIQPSVKARFTIKPTSEELTTFLQKETPRMMRFMAAESITIDPDFAPKSPLPSYVSPEAEVFLHLDSAIDVEAEAARMQKKLEEHDAYISRLKKKLANEKFVQNAPAEIVEAERGRLAEACSQRERVQEIMSFLKTESNG